MKNKIINRVVWAIIALAAMGISYLLTVTVFLNLHGMLSWPLTLFIFGLIVLLISAVFNCKKVMIGVVTGYIIGFALGMLFQTDIIINPLGETGSNGWIIWTISYLVIIFASITWEIISKHKSKKINKTIQ